jgi:hypothetical protein
MSSELYLSARRHVALISDSISVIVIHHVIVLLYHPGQRVRSARARPAVLSAPAIGCH